MTSSAVNPKIAVQKVADPPQARKFTFEWKLYLLFKELLILS